MKWLFVVMITAVLISGCKLGGGGGGGSETNAGLFGEIEGSGTILPPTYDLPPDGQDTTPEASPIPEPATAIILGLGLAGLAAARFLKPKK